MNKLKVILSFILLMYLAGCSAVPSSSSKQRKEVEVYAGFEGLSVAFAKNAPPLQVFEDIDFPIMLRISNRGAYTLTNNQGLLQISVPKDLVKNLKLERDSRASSTAKDNEALFEIEGKSLINAKGEEIIVIFTAKAGKLPSNQIEQKVNMHALLCYPYKTTLSATVCIDPDYAGLSAEKKVCTVKDVIYQAGQGAPIAITKIEEYIVPDKDDPNKVKPRFIIYLENKGKRAPISDKDGKLLENCRNPNIEKENPQESKIFNIALLKAEMLDESGQFKNLECTKDQKSDDKTTGIVRFVDDKDAIRCTLQQGISKTKAAYATPLKVEVTYGYSQVEPAEFLLKKYGR